MKKRLIAIILMLSMVLSMAACGDSEESIEPEEENE